MAGFATGLEMFQNFESYFTADKEIRQKIRDIILELETTSRQLNCLMDIIHLPKPLDMPQLLNIVTPLYEDIKAHYSKLRAVVPATDYYKYHESWKSVTQQICSKVCLMFYLEHGTLLDRAGMAQVCGVESDTEQQFHLCLEDYLIGVLFMATELARLTVNRVTAKDYNKPLEIANFVRELEAGFRMLNLKNDFLRKRYDALKYDVKKIEEVVYDVTLRGLQKDAE